MSQDAELLRRYATDHSEAAFSELVRRNVDLVYSAALRLTGGDIHRAEDVSQQVFCELARQANRLTNHPSLAGWLYTTTRRMGSHALRTERRRTAREQEATTMNELTRETGLQSDWEQLRPALEDAMHDLCQEDRLAVLLRYFQNKRLNEVGQALGLSDNAARMRVDRAVEKLRKFFTKRGIALPAVALTGAISANAVQAAPVGLAVTISTAATLGGTTIGATAIATATKTIAMTTLQKTFVTATVAVLAGAGIYEARQASNARAEVDTLREQQAPLNEQIQQLAQERDAARSKLALAQTEHERLNRNTSELLKLRGELAVARRELTDMKAGKATSKNDSKLSFDKNSDPSGRIAGLKERWLQHVQRVQEASRKMDQLVRELQIPNEVVTNIHNTTELSHINLTPYQRYFEVARERENLQQFQTILERKIISELFDATTNAITQ